MTNTTMQFCEKCRGEIRGEVCPACVKIESGPYLQLDRLDLSKFTPNFSELTLYSMALTVALIFVFYQESRAFVSSMLEKEEAIIFIGYMAVGIFTLCRCVVHAFTRKRKTDLEKRLMLSFALLTNFLAGIHAGAYAWDHTTGPYAIFPALNILNCFILGLLVRLEIITFKNISDENVPLWQAVTSTITVLIVFFVFKVHLERQWYFTLSACVFYATNINRPVIVAIGNLRTLRRPLAKVRS